MKTLTVQVPSEQLNSIMAEAQDGDVVVLTDGERQMILRAGASDVEEGRPELAAAFLLTQKKPSQKLSRQHIEEVAEELRKAKEAAESKDPA